MGGDDSVQSARAPRTSPQAHPGASLGDYRLIAKLARGGMGVLYLATPRRRGAAPDLVAIKELRRELAGDEALVAMFLEEAHLAARLDHPNIVRTLAVGSSDGRHFIVMEYLEGRSLQRLVQRAHEHGFGVPLAVRLGVAVDLLSALDYAHRSTGPGGAPLGVVHRDVSPHNVFVTYDGQVKLLDFGIAQTHDGPEGSRTGVLKGKARYMSPEQAACGPVDARADLFSVGIMLWEAVVGRRPWEGKSDADILESLARGAVPLVRDARPDADADLAAVVDRAMSPEPGARYPSALAMRGDLARYMVGRAMSVDPARALAALVGSLFAEDRARFRALVDAQLRAPEDPARPSRSSAPLLAMAVSVGAAAADHDEAIPGAEIDVDFDFEPDEQAAAAAEPLSPASASDPPASAIRPTARSESERSARPRPAVSASVLLSPPARPAAASWRLPVAVGAGVLLAAGGYAAGRASAVRSAQVSPASVEATAVPAPSPAKPRSRAAHVVVRASPPTARIFLDDREVDNPFVSDRAGDATEHVLRVEAPGYVTKTSTVSFAQDARVAVDLGRADDSSAATTPIATATTMAAAPSSGAGEATSAAPLPSAARPIDTGNPYGR